MESLKSLKIAFKSGLTKNIEFRKIQLRSLFKMVEVHEKEFCEALRKDMNKSEAESKLSEILPAKQEISYLLKNMDGWLANEKVGKTFVTLTDSTWIQRQPFGVALCIGAWNYPVTLNLSPLAGLIAAGNCVILKPSEISVNTEKLLADLIPKYLDERVCIVELGDGKRTTEILRERFDFIFFTGSPMIGKIIMEAASKHLTPIALELGGKSPVYIDNDVEMKMAVKRIVWGKFLNCGQTCLAPDYVLCHKDSKDSFLQHTIDTIEEFFTSKAITSPDYPRIINEKHYKRLMTMLSTSKGKVIVGCDSSEEARFISPTIVLLNSMKDSLMESEIFGPILPIITVDSKDQAINIINEGEKPLSIYVFSNNKAVQKQFESDTSSGSLVLNDCVVQFAVKGLPFGGVGESGLGCYHGKFSIDQFSHRRSILNKDTKEIVNNLFRYPPYNASKTSWAEWGLKSDDKNAGYCSLM